MGEGLTAKPTDLSQLYYGWRGVDTEATSFLTGSSQSQAQVLVNCDTALRRHRPSAISDTD